MSATQWHVRDAEIPEPVKALSRTREEWVVTVVSNLANTKSASLRSVAKDPSRIYSSTRSDVVDHLRELNENDPDATQQEKAEVALHLASSSQETWKSERQSTTTRKAFSGLQSTICTISDFLQSFSGVAEIVKGADQQYGGLAYGTISLLLSVAVHKRQREEAIEEALTELTYAFPRLRILQALGPRQSLRQLVLEVFEKVISFCRDVTEYYARSIGRRVRDALSPEKLKMRALSQIRSKLLEVRKECDISMLERLADLEKKLEAIQRTGIDTNSQVRATQRLVSSTNAKADNELLASLRAQLKLPQAQDGSLPNVDMTTYQRRLIQEFGDQRIKCRSPRPLSWQLFEKDKSFSGWLHEQSSTMLLLGGSNFNPDSAVQLNWLSYASIMAVEQARKRAVGRSQDFTADPVCVLFFFCQPDYTGHSRRNKRTFSDVICHLVYQLAGQYPEKAPSWRHTIDACRSSRKWQDEDRCVAYEAMVGLLKTLLAGIDEVTEITIVVDRLDQCRWSEDPEDKGNGLNAAFWAFLRLVQDESLGYLRLKVLMVMDDAPATAISLKSKGPKLMCKVDWQHEEDDES